MKAKNIFLLSLVSILSLATTSLLYTNKMEEFLESTNSCDNVFGKSIEANKNNQQLLSLENMVKPKLGYQVAYTDSDLDGNNDYVSIRFTAAIRSLDCSCVWTRALYDENGSVYTPLKEKEVEVTTGYTGVTANGKVTYATSVEDENGDHPYNYFVVYTLLNIPLESYSNYYLDCMLTISDNTDNIQSSVGALKVDLTDMFSYEKTNDLTFEKEGDSFSVKSAVDKEEIVIPTYASNADYRLPVTKVMDGAFSNKETLKRVIANNNVVEIDDTFDNSSLFEGFYSYANYGDLTFDNSIENKVYYYSEECKDYNAWRYVGNVISTEYEHNPKEAVVENDTATCISDGTKDLVVYCLDCGKELSRETITSLAKGHEYEEETEIMNGHSHTKHECSRCHDFWYDQLVVDYTKNYDYVTYNNYDDYSLYRDILNKWYKELYDGCMEVLESTIDYDDNTNLIQVSSFEAIDAAWVSNFAGSFLTNNPQFYFLDNHYMWYYYETTPITYQLCLKIEPTFYDHNVRKEIQDNLLLFEKDVTSRLTDSMTDYDKAVLIHDYLCENNFYQYVNGEADTSIWSHSICGITDMDQSTGTVCEGYAKAYQYLSNLIGIETISVVGIAGTNEKYGGHAWNYTKIDGAWYGVDVTWDDGDGTYYDYEYFLCSNSRLDYYHYQFHQPGESDITVAQTYFQVLLPELSENNYLD